MKTFGTWGVTASFSLSGVIGSLVGGALIFTGTLAGLPVLGWAFLIFVVGGVAISGIDWLTGHLSGEINKAATAKITKTTATGKMITGAAIAGYIALSAVAVTDVAISTAPNAYNDGYESGMSEIRSIENSENMEQGSNVQAATPTRKPTKTPTSRPNPTKTPQPNFPTLYADKNYNCRESPWTTAAHVADIPAGTTHRIIGRASNGWYAIAISFSNTSHTYCWIGGGNVSGDLSTVKYYEVQPPSTSSESGQVTIVDGTSTWNNNACYNNYDPNNCYALYSLTPIGSLTCDELKSYGWDEPFLVNGKTLWKLHALTLFGSSEPAFYNSEAKSACPSLFP